VQFFITCYCSIKCRAICWIQLSHSRISVHECSKFKAHHEGMPGVEVQLHSSKTSTLDTCESSVSRSSRISQRRRARGGSRTCLCSEQIRLFSLVEFEPRFRGLAVRSLLTTSTVLLWLCRCADRRSMMISAQTDDGSSDNPFRLAFM
jgi:hypothetical protein